jgi:hypothetical protein
MDSSKAFEGGERLKANGLEWFVAQHTCCGGTQGQIEVQDQKGEGEGHHYGGVGNRT